MKTLKEKIAKFLAIDTGYGLKIFDGCKVYYVDDVPTLIYSIKRDLAKGAIVNKDFTLTECYVAKVGNFFGHGETTHEAYTAAE